MFGRQTTGSVVCVACGYLVGVNDERCYNCGRRNPGLWGYAAAVRQLGSDMGFIPFVIGLCVIMYVLTLIASRGDIMGGGSPLALLSPTGLSLFLFGASGAVPVINYNRWWTVLSASWLHGSLIHIFMNLYWVRQIGPAVSDLYGPGRLVIIYTVSGAVGFALTSVAGAYLGFLPMLLRGAPLTVGASASIFGLFGALVYYGRRTGSSATYKMAMQYVLIMFVFGLIMPGIDNYAHAGGFIGGYAASQLLDPLKPERITHMVWAIVCLVLSVLSIAASVVLGLPLL
ncbi:MAG TPA: rhomboid family intramembrane serine protease [Vicinamibacterales bacterium]|nr:rhomboid family intramembrane serine protease [Vicinamibacterales bacterium]